MNVAIIGTGYVGLVTAACLAELGNTVYGIDKDSSKVEKLRRLQMPFYEPGLDEIVKNTYEKGNLVFCSSLKEINDKLDIIFICVGTYPLEDGYPDVSDVKKAAEEISENIAGNEYTVVVQKSTAPPGTVEIVKEILQQKNPGESFGIVSNPEFLKESTAIEDTYYPDRIVIGADNEKAFSVIRDLFDPIIEKSKCPVYKMKPIEAELVKYAANAFLATKISYANSIAMLCDKLGSDIKNVVKGFGSDRRIGAEFLKSGIGYGGSCLPKDVKGLISISKKHGMDFNLLQEVEVVNDNVKDYFIEKISKEFNGDFKKEFAVFGLSFKPNTDDLRESPALSVLEKLIRLGAKTKVHDPVVDGSHVHLEIEMSGDPYEAARNSHAAIFLTEWDEYRNLDFKKLYGLMNQPIIFDGRNMLDGEMLLSLGFKYFDIGSIGS